MAQPQEQRRQKSLRERAYELMSGLPETTQAALSPLLGGPEGVGLLDLLPGTGQALSADWYTQARASGDSLGQGLAALGAIPVVGAAGRGARVAAKGARTARGAPRVGSAATAAGKAAEGPRAAQATTRAGAPRRRVGGPLQSLRELSWEEAAALARQEPHLAGLKKNDPVPGAPRGMRLRDIQALRDRVDADVAEGAGGRDWYERAQAYNSEVSAPPGRANALPPNAPQRAAYGQAVTSPQADPNTNQQFWLQGHNAYVAGAPAEKMRTGPFANQFNAMMDEPVPTGSLGPKTDPYRVGLDPTQPSHPTGVNDQWHARAFGFANEDGTPFNRALSKPEHDFLDYETVLAAARANDAAVGGASDWTGPRAQAAIWVRNKALGLMERNPKLSYEEAFERANKTYADFADQHVAYGTHEAVPGVGTGHLEGVSGGPEDVRRAFSEDPRSNWRDERGRDIIYDALGMYVRPTRSAQGVYDGPGGVEFNPAEVARPLVSFTPGADGPRDVDAPSRAMMDAAEAARAFIDAQNAGAWHKPILTNSPSVSNSLSVSTGRRLTPEEAVSVRRAGAERGLPDVVDTGEGVTVTRFWPPPEPMDRRALMSASDELTRMLPGAERVSRADVRGGYVGYEDAWPAGEGSGEATRALLEKIDRPDFPRIMQSLDASPMIREAAKARLERDIEWAARTGSPLREDLQLARRIISQEGFSGLARALKEGRLLPAAVLPALAAASLDRE